MKKKRSESQKVKDARYLRAQRLGIAFQQWAKLAEQKLYPKSLHQIALAALEREYKLGRRASSGAHQETPK